MNTSTLIRISGIGPAKAGPRQWAALVVLMLPALLVSVDNTVLSFALPQISRDLEPTSAQQLWIIDIYALVLAALLVTMGSLGDRFGRRRMLLIGSSGFAVVSVLAAFATSAEQLIAARALLGIFGAMLMPSTLSLLRTIFVDRDQRRLAVAIWATAFSAGGALGPVIGGVLLQHFAWGSVFLLAVPMLVPLLILAPFLLRESRDPYPGRIDVLSILLSVLAMGPIVYAIKDLAVDGPSVRVAVLAVVGVVGGILFVRRQLRLDTPMLDMSLFRVGTFSGALGVNLLSVIAFVGFIYFISQHLQLVLGLEPLDAALVLLPGMVIMVVAGLLVVPIGRRVPPHILIPSAMVFSVAGYLACAFAAGTVGVVMFAFALLGIGIGMAETVSNELALSSAPPAKAGAASAVSETAYELGAVLGTAVLGGLVTALYRANLTIPAGVPAPSAAEARETLAGAMDAADELGGTLGAALRDAAAHAFESGASVTAFIGAGLIVVAAVVAATTLRRARALR